MQLIYIHGLNSSHLAEKGQLLKSFCEKNFPDIQVHCPNLNHAPDKVVQILTDLIAKDAQTGLVGSSLGGYFATLLANQYDCKTVLINPSTNPGESLTRFYDGDVNALADDFVLYTTPLGWQITKADLDWLKTHRPKVAIHADKFLVLLKTGDEVLDYRKAVDFYSQNQHQSHLVIEDGGDHNMSDFATKLEQVIAFLFGKMLS
ncbi:hypothetical protein MOMA_04250 [Moraxella macacae 0408225]|uniref:Esterase YqiA n=1 Tax=Moraxella macacae 0408225 TaxID=1230338 RepID=L2FA22_9GAMM|nr:YqiA/YcfP family alpha/beta fold hydrolase [Moraxella macacae]ELA09586.1 hypothetical protein MOMA_04250 [Moraxella macacae 0408225]